ncbi:hypothetical protein E4K67_15045 [Desulfosporosinus fructosivorans]|uniref:Uncharacterized protein n=1 Tax=Desulfosporosinus fructosivorans TaxID=2018669 RepID=A0A4Z0R3Z6_9FIRM|nr:hypothetical protein [Desulfosporosinus fructosivorans]TGE37189.1 hypothetical protein E4K67_15045 [Desulfosporosinus fructosivorans]
MKKIFSCLMLTFVMVFSITCTGFASTNNAENYNSIMNPTFTKNTLITKDNVNEILEYYGLDRSALREDMDDKSFGDVTVGDFENALNKAKKIPKMIVTDNNNPTNQSSTKITSPDGNSPMAATSVQTVTTDSEVWSGGPVVRYACSGEAYNNYSTTKYWIGPLGGANILMVTGQVGTIYYAVDSITRLITTVQNPSTSSSKLVLDYNYKIGTYTGIKGMGGIRIATNTVAGTNYYGISYIQ